MKFVKINHVFIVLLLIAFNSCNGKSKEKSIDSSLTKINDTTKSNKIKDSINRRKAIDSEMLLGNRPDSEQATPSSAQERERLIKKYDQITIIDSIFVINNDTLHFHLKYYCLKNSNLVISKSYYTDEKNPKDFLTHEFVSEVLLINKRDTVLSKQFKASDFTPFLKIILEVA
jgi:hypothetical protein